MGLNDEVSPSNNFLEAQHEQKKGGLLEIDATRDITTAEHDLKFWTAVQQYPTAVLWSLFFCIAVIMAGFDAQLVTSFYALPAFQQRFGSQYQGSWEITAPWQMLGDAPSR